MNIEKYKIFLLVSQNKKISEIAKLMGISQPTVSFHIKSLEDSLGVQLFHADKKVLTLTDTGRHLLPYAKEIVELEDNMIERAYQYRNFNYGEIYIGSTLSPGVSLLPYVIKNYSSVYNKIHITMEISATNTIIQNTLSKKYDIGLVATNSDIPSSLVSETLIEDQLILVFHPDLLSVFQNDSSLNILKQFNFIHHSHGSSTRKMVDSFFCEYGLKISSTVTANSIEMIKIMIMNNIGISFLPYSLVSDDVAAERIATIPLSASLPAKMIKLIYPDNRYIAPHILKFIEYIKIDHFVNKPVIIG